LESKPTGRLKENKGVGRLDTQKGYIGKISSPFRKISEKGEGGGKKKKKRRKDGD